MGRMKTSKVKAIVSAEIEQAKADSSLSAERAENLRYYLGDKFGNEQEGRSQVVSSDVADTIEWMMPELVRVFASGEDAVTFDPVGEEDQETSEQATAYANYIWMRDNDGFLNFYTWFKDALLSKNGFIKIWWDETEVAKRSAFNGLDDQQFAEQALPDDVKVSEHTDHGDGFNDAVFTKKTKRGRVNIQPVPPEEFLISKDARTIEDARFVGQLTLRTRSDLVADGYDKAMVDELTVSNRSEIDSEEGKERDRHGDEGDGAQLDKSMEEIEVIECYLKLDYDGDGIAEMRQITVAGSDHKVLRNEAWDCPTPFASLTPVIMPHRFYGLALADLVKDIQLIKSTILRQYLDGLYLANNPRQEAVESNIIDPSELLTARVGGIIRVKEINSINAISQPFQGGQALEGLAYIDQTRENRTGVSPRTQGVGDNPLHDTLGGEQLLFNAAQSKIELIARIFAETGVKTAFKIVLALVTKYQKEVRDVRIKKEWVQMDPSSWNQDMDVSVQVGMGMGDKQQQLSMAMSLLNIQKEAMANGLATPTNLLETVEIIINAMGFKGVERFFNVPAEGEEQPQQPPDPEAIKLQQEMQLAQMKLEQEMQIEQMKLQMKERQFMAELEVKKEQIALELVVKKNAEDVQMGGQGG